MHKFKDLRDVWQEDDGIRSIVFINSYNNVEGLSVWVEHVSVVSGKLCSCFRRGKYLLADDFLSLLFQEVSVYVLGWENRIACIKKRIVYYLQLLLFLFYCVVQHTWWFSR